MNAPMHDPHPPAEQFDRLRAGLLDDHPEAGARLREHLSACAHCRALATWDPLNAALGDPALDAAALSGELRNRRRAALSGRAGRRRLHAPPRLAFAAAMAALLIGAGVFLALDPLDDKPATTLARNGNVPDIYADLDFYLWLSRENEQNDSAAGRS